MRTFGTTTALCLALALPATAIAQDTGKGFLFGAPSGSVTLRGGWASATANSDLFRFTTQNLTLNRRDFSSLEGGIDLAIAVRRSTQILLSADVSGMNKQSEFRNFIDNNDAPIQQSTSFHRVPLTIAVKQYLTSPGQTIGRFAWIPSRAALFVGAGGGIEYYRFLQRGDFVDFNTMDVFSDTFTSEGNTGTAIGFAGFDYTLAPRWAITTEERYSYARARLSNDFSGFQRLDLSGFSTSIGFTVRF